MNNVIYHPFQGVKSFTLTHGANVQRPIDLAGRIKSFTLGTTTVNLTYDDSHRLSGFSGGVNQSFTYDSVDRLLSQSGAASYTYNTTGDRLTKNQGGLATYNYPATSHRLQNITGSGARSFTHDPNGSITHDGTTTFTYDLRGRLIQAQQGAITASYGINALGQRITKQVGATITHFHYDSQGKLIAESTPDGQAIQETVYLGDLPVAVRKGGQDYAVYADHLGTPRRIENSSQQAVWLWDLDDPFGNHAANEDPSGLGVFNYNPRFPGQYFDQETGNHYNYFRDCYDARTGRYCQSDPIGLEGGINTYAYAANNPLGLIDAQGLQFDIPESDPKYPPHFPGPWHPQPSCEDPCEPSITMTHRGICRPGDIQCGMAMKAAGIQGLYYPTTKRYSIKCLVSLGLLKGPASAAGNALAKRVGGWSHIIWNHPVIAPVAVGYTADGILKTCECPLN